MDNVIDVPDKIASELHRSCSTAQSDLCVLRQLNDSLQHKLLVAKKRYYWDESSSWTLVKPFIALLYGHTGQRCPAPPIFLVSEYLLYTFFRTFSTTDTPSKSHYMRITERVHKNACLLPMPWVGFVVTSGRSQGEGKGRLVTCHCRHTELTPGKIRYPL
jgi:hypothetical protein